MTGFDPRWTDPMESVIGVTREILEGWGIAGADFTAISSEYDRGAQLCYRGGHDTEGHFGADQFCMGLRAAFSHAVFAVRHVIGREDLSLSPRAATRWSLHGKRDGWGSFGRPSGAEVYVKGITYAEFGLSGLRREFTLIDEVAIWKQNLLRTGEV